ncbi:MAG: HEAT repeat domain-containing protein [Deltaproteobacteria bacterium]|nr:HEAT repeat domain-containing protein [Deltaproteobacteria bacterium]
MSEEERYAALKGRRGAADDAADEARLLALGDASFRVRAEAVEQLAGRPASIRIENALVAGLGAGDNAGLRNAACDLMIRYGRTVAPAVARAVRADDADVRKLAIDVAGEISHPSLADVLLSALRDTNVNVRIAAAEALGNFDSNDVESALIAGLDDGELVFELACLESLARRRCAVSAVTLGRHLRDPYKRRAALAVLGFTPGEDSLNALLGALGDERVSTLVAAVRALGAWLESNDRTTPSARDAVTRRVRAAIPLDREDEFVTRIEALLADESVARAAALVLGRLGFARSALALALAARQFPMLEADVDDALRALDSRAADDLARALRQASVEDWVWIVRALDVLGDIRGASALIARCERGPEPDRHLIDALGRVADRRAIPILFRCAKSIDSEVSDLAARSLRALATRQPETLARDLAALSDDDYRAARGVEVEGALGANANEKRIVRLLDDGPDEDRVCAIRALAEICSPLILSRCRELARTAATEVRVAAVAALGSYSMDTTDAASAESRSTLLVALLDNPDARIREAAASALESDDNELGTEALARVAHGSDLSVTLAALRALAARAARGRESAWKAILAFYDGERRRGVERFSNPLSVEVWKETLAALSHAPVPAAFEILVENLGSERWDVRAVAARALGSRRDRNGFTPLRAALQRESDVVVRRALEDALVTLARESRGI